MTFTYSLDKGFLFFSMNDNGVKEVLGRQSEQLLKQNLKSRKYDATLKSWKVIEVLK